MTISPESFGDRLKRLVALRVAGALSDNPDAVAKLAELGVLDEAWLADPSSDPLAPLLRLRELSRAVAKEPSMLEGLDLRPIQVLGAQAEVSGAQSALGSAGDTRLTIVFTDLEGFTSYTSESGDVVAGRVLRSHYSTVDEIVEGRGGSVVKRLGDGHMVTFATPRSAVMASLELVRAAPGNLRLRAGGHLGSVVRLGDDVVGHAVNLASRVADSASAGHVRVTVAVREGAGDVRGVRFGPPVDENFKGIDGSVAVCEVSAG